MGVDSGSHNDAGSSWDPVRNYVAEAPPLPPPVAQPPKVDGVTPMPPSSDVIAQPEASPSGPDAGRELLKILGKIKTTDR